jgi:hypothetical protein
MISLKVLGISKSEKVAFCEIIKRSYGLSEILGKGNIKVSEKLDINSVHKTDCLNCKVVTRAIGDKSYDWLILEDSIPRSSSEIAYLILEDDLLAANLLIQEIILNGDAKDILIQIIRIYYQYLSFKFDMPYSIDFDDNLYFEELDIEEILIDRFNDHELSLTDKYLKKLATFKSIVNKRYDNIDFFQLGNVISKDELIKIYYLNTEVELKKYYGKTIGQILKIDPHYIIWCICNLNHFADVSLCTGINKESFSVNLIKIEIKAVQDTARTAMNKKTREEKQLYNEMLNDGIREAYNDDPSNLWNTD